MYPSPFMTSLFIAGIIICGIAPPIGLALIGLGVVEQRRLNKQIRGRRSGRQAAARRAELEKAWRYFAS